MNPTPDIPGRLADLSEFAGTFVDGYTEDDIDSKLSAVGELLGLDLRCVWEYQDDCGTGGHSEFIAVKDGKAYDTPARLYEVLSDPDCDDTLVANTLGPERTDIVFSELIETGSWGTNLVYEDRLADDEDEDDD